MTTSQTSVPAPRATANPARKRALLTLTGVVVLAGLGWAAYEWLVASHYESTDNAYVQGNVIQITPQIGGLAAQVGTQAAAVEERQPQRRPDTPLLAAGAQQAVQANAGETGKGHQVDVGVKLGTGAADIPGCGLDPPACRGNVGATPQQVGRQGSRGGYIFDRRHGRYLDRQRRLRLSQQSA